MDVNNSHYWFPLLQNLKEISSFLQSVNEKDIGDGFVSFDPVRFLLHSRSAVSSNYYWQKAVNVWNPQATFTQTKEAFEVLNRKVSFVYEQLVQFPSSRFRECTGSIGEFVTLFSQEIPKMMEVAKAGLAKLAVNYETAKKKEKGTALLELGNKAFKILKKSREISIARFLLNLTEKEIIFNLVQGIRKLSETVKLLPQTCEKYRLVLRKMAFSPITGVIVPDGLFEEVLKGQRENGNNESFRLMVNFQQIPLQAKSIPAQGGLLSGSLGVLYIMLKKMPTR